MENFKPPEINKKTIKEGEVSVFLENYNREVKKIAKLEEQIEERKKFLEKESDPEMIEKIKKEIEELEKAEATARSIASVELNFHKATTEMLEDFDPDKEDGRA